MLRFTKIANGLYVPGDSEALYASKFQDSTATLTSPISLVQGLWSESLSLAKHFEKMTLKMLSWAILETCCVQWIFRSLLTTINKLKISFVLICFFWSPSQKPTRYLYSAEMVDDFEEDELSLTESGLKSEDGVIIEMNVSWMLLLSCLGIYQGRGIRIYLRRLHLAQACINIFT
ncbi:unnamed protein product [Arabidopsis thaliana]|uniref:(thale cress) hypothetical protein n=1 Tax=Arabidopsis thaliana TaxID=3702 RepID=A0A7G2DQ43_ARATH|nr:unnamed protein product [Arabidopsis thaliana]